MISTLQVCRTAHIDHRGRGSAIVTHRPICPSAMPNHRAYGAACISAHPEARLIHHTCASLLFSRVRRDATQHFIQSMMSTSGPCHHTQRPALAAACPPPASLRHHGWHRFTVDPFKNASSAAVNSLCKMSHTTILAMAASHPGFPSSP